MASEFPLHGFESTFPVPADPEQNEPFEPGDVYDTQNQYPKAEEDDSRDGVAAETSISAWRDENHSQSNPQTVTVAPGQTTLKLTREKANVLKDSLPECSKIADALKEAGIQMITLVRVQEQLLTISNLDKPLPQRFLGQFHEICNEAKFDQNQSPPAKNTTKVQKVDIGGTKLSPVHLYDEPIHIPPAPLSLNPSLDDLVADESSILPIPSLRDSAPLMFPSQLYQEDMTGIKVKEEEREDNEGGMEDTEGDSTTEGEQEKEGHHTNLKVIKQMKKGPIRILFKKTKPLTKGLVSHVMAINPLQVKKEIKKECNIEDVLPRLEPSSRERKSTGPKGPNKIRKDSLECKNCYKLFRKESTLTKHLQSCMNKTTDAKVLKKKRKDSLECKNCHKLFRKELTLTKHLESCMNNAQDFECPYCPEILKGKWAFLNHKNQHFPIEKYPTTAGEKINLTCLVCNETFPKPSGLRAHERKHLGIKQYTCDLCGKSFMHPRYLKNHVKNHKGSRVWQCDDCGKGFVQRQNLERHKKIHAGKKDFKCRFCGLAFQRAVVLRNHETTHSGEKNFKCSECDEAFRLLDQVKRHEETHEGPKEHICQTCGKAYKHFMNLKTHERSHTMVARKNDKAVTVKCETCGRIFNSYSCLWLHKKKHTGKKDKICSWCAKGFYTTASLKIHEKTHLDLREFRCSMCPASFVQGSHLKRHERVHSGKRDHVCVHCGKAFTEKYNLTQHIKLHEK